MPFDYRMTLAERGQLAAELRQFIAEKEQDQARLGAIADAELNPKFRCLYEAYAFEFFLERYRKKFEIAIKNIDYFIGWCWCNAEKFEMRPLEQTLIRTSVEMFMDSESDSIERAGAHLFESEFAESGIDQLRIKTFFWEIVYELVAQMTQSRYFILHKKSA